MKSEPEVYSISDLEKDGRAEWEGVRNYQARNSMREMHVGDLVLYYHSNASPPGVAGLARICKEAYPDATQFDAESRYYDGKSDPAAPRWDLVDMEHVETFAEPVSLERLKQAGELEGMLVIRRGMRLSVQPVDKDHFKAVLRMAGSNTRIR